MAEIYITSFRTLQTVSFVVGEFALQAHVILFLFFHLLSHNLLILFFIIIIVLFEILFVLSSRRKWLLAHAMVRKTATNANSISDSSDS